MGESPRRYYPLTPQDRATITEAIEQLPVADRGHDVPLLVRAMQAALRVETDSFAIDLQLDSSFTETVDKLQPGLTRAVKQVRSLVDACGSDRRPWSDNIDPLAVAVGQRMDVPAGDEFAPVAIADALRLIASTTLRPAPKRPPGRPKISDLVAIVVRVCWWYAVEQGIPVQRSWKRATPRQSPGSRGGAQLRLRHDDLTPPSRLTMLIEVTLAAFGIPAPRSRIKSEFLEFGKMLRKRGSGPKPSDFLDYFR